MTVQTATTAERRARCRVLNARSDRCQNEVIDPDPAAPQFCARHALEGAMLLVDAGAIRITYTDRARKAAS